MKLLNTTKMQAGYTMGLKPNGRELLVVVVKGTFTIPKKDERPRLADEQVPLVESDEFSGEPGLSAPVYETDYAPFKARCDVLLNGSAHVPHSQFATEIPVSLQVGSMLKTFKVVGDRVWTRGPISVGASRPMPFSQMPISYDNAFGGTDNTYEDSSRHKAIMNNPIGVGFHDNLKSEFVDRKPLPNTEELNNPIRKPGGKYRPMSFGPIGRGWEPRYKLAGTYDQNWVDNVFPFLPTDFNEAYYQCAPADQQIDYLKGGEAVDLSNLTPQGRTQFRIPEVEIPVVFFRKKGESHKTFAVADTLVLEPDFGRFIITWRASLLLKKNMFEIVQVLTGEMSRAWWRARELGKTYYSSLDAVVRKKREEAGELA